MKTHIEDEAVKRSAIMRGGTLAQLPVFLAVAEHRSFSRAAKALSVSTSAVSQAISRLEEEVGGALFVRTTRSVNLTDAGTRLVTEAAPAVTALTSALSGITKRAREPMGTLRLNVPRIARPALGPILERYTKRHPDVLVDVIVDDKNVDIVTEGFDAGIRMRESVQADMVTVRLAPAFRFIVVGSKKYLAEHGRPTHPRDLLQHTCICWRSLTTGEIYRWEFEERGRVFEVAVTGAIRTNGAEMLVECASRHLGLAFVAEPEALLALERGEVERVLEKWCPESPGLFLYYPRAAQRVAKLAAFVACVREELNERASRTSGPRASRRPR